MTCGRDIEVDVLVVGAGPAGSSAAAKTAEVLDNVLLVDRRTSPGLPVQCAEWVPMTLTVKPEVRKSCVQLVNGMQTFLPSGSCHSASFSGFMIDREKLDSGMQERACEYGATLWQGACFRGLMEQENIALIMKGHQLCHVHYGVLIAADGPCSRVAYHLGLPGLKLMHSLQYTVPLSVVSTTVSIWLSPHYPGGYAWLFPKGKVANLGVGFDTAVISGSRIDLKRRLDDLFESLIASGVIERDILMQTGGPIPVSGLRDPLFKRNIMFAGDAAGCANPLTGAGISSAVISGEMAGEAAIEFLREKDGSALQRYQEDLGELLSRVLSRDAVSREKLMRCWSATGKYNEAEASQYWIGFDEYAYESHELSSGYGMR